MISPKLLEIARDVRKLSLAEQQWLLENLAKRIQSQTQNTGKFSDLASLKQQLQELAQDSEIQKEVMAINQEFEMIDLAQWRELREDFYDLLVAHTRQDEEEVSWQDIKQEIEADSPKARHSPTGNKFPV